MQASIPRSTLERATAAHQAGELSEAERLYQAALRDDSGNVEVLYRMSVLNAQLGRFDRALEFAERALAGNPGNVTAQLISRHWIITDSQGLVQEVRGLGVVGAQPVLRPGESFEYTSGTSIATPVGTMRGSYQMVAEDGTRFEAPIAEFTLSVPRVLH